MAAWKTIKVAIPQRFSSVDARAKVALYQRVAIVLDKDSRVNRVARLSGRISESWLHGSPRGWELDRAAFATGCARTSALARAIDGTRGRHMGICMATALAAR